MSLPVTLLPEASWDAAEARDYHERRQVGLGDVFVERLRETLARVSDSPLIYAVAWRNVRIARLRQFEYIVCFRMKQERIEVLAIVHGSRDPTVWKSRV